jgi:hypothetical protein
MATERESPEHALDRCLVNLEAASALPLARGVRATIYEKAIGKFKEFDKEWNADPDTRLKVLRSAAFIGHFGTLFALFDESAVVSEKNAFDAIEVVKRLCDAGNNLRLKWCP